MNLLLFTNNVPRKAGILLVILAFIFIINPGTFAQCPSNIDFESGTFAGWKLYTGSVSTDIVTDTNVITLNEVPGPVPGRHEMLSASPGDGLDEYGSFPKNCPNGSGHSIKLGNNLGGNQAEGVSYEFTIPPTANQFSLIYYYAVVIQDPGHQRNEQPRLVIDVMNVTDNVPVGCSSFAFIASGGLPGFQLSPRPGSNSPVWYKTWSANSINLDGNQGKTIRIFFKTADCTFVSHFGYAYIDVSTECSSSFIGAAFCQADTAVNVAAPFGYLNYTWYDQTFTQVLGTNQTLHISPPPPSGTNVYVKLTPYAGYGCVDTLKASLVDTLTVIANAGADKASCNGNAVQIGAPGTSGLVYHWAPPEGLSNPDIANPFALVTTPTQYVLTVTTPTGGCITTDTVIIKADVLDSAIELLGSESFCSASGQTAVLRVHPTDSIQWYQDDIAIPGAHAANYNVTQTGSYKATLFSNGGCILTTAIKNITVYPSPVAGFGVNNTTQCFLSNQFNFADASTIASGTPEYSWEFGDGTVEHTKDVAHSYKQPGIYNVKLTVKGVGECTDSKVIAVTVLPSAIAAFSTKNVCVNLDLPLVNNITYPGSFAINYLWDFGNGDQSSLSNPVYKYTIPGTYQVSLATNTTQCPQQSIFTATVVVDSPEPGMIYPVQSAIFNYPLRLSARQIGAQALWTPSTNLSNPVSFEPLFKGITEQLYNIRITTISGCVTTDTQLVKTIKKIEVHVPGAFTPDGDGNNDFLRPLLYGFKKVNHFRVYSRWGKLLFHMESDLPGWDGKLNNVPQEMQTVIWILEAEDVDGKLHVDKGSTILIR